MGVLIIRAPLFGVYSRSPDFWKLWTLDAMENFTVVPAEALIQDPCPFGMPELLTGAQIFGAKMQRRSGGNFNCTFNY